MATLGANISFADSGVERRLSFGGASHRVISVVAFVCVVAACCYVAEVRPLALVDSQTLVSIWTFLSKLFPPDFSPAFLNVVARAVGQTIAIAVAGTALSIVIGLSLGIVSTATLWRRGVLLEAESQSPTLYAMAIACRSARTLLGLLRAVPDLLWGLLFVVAVGLGPLAGVLTLAVAYGGVLGRVYADVFEDVDPRPVEALHASGATRAQVFLRAVWPQAVPRLTAYTLYSLECSVRAASILGFVGAGGIGHEINISMRLFEYGQVSTLILALVILLTANDAFSRFLRRRLHAIRAPGVSSIRRHSEQVINHIAVHAPYALSRPLRWFGQRLNWLVVIGILCSSFYATGITQGTLFDAAIIERVFRFVAAMFPPDFDFVFVSGLVKPLFQTIAISVLGTMLGIFLGAALALPATSTLMFDTPDAAGRQPLLDRGARAVAYRSARLVFTVLRSIPELVWVLICILAVGLGPFAGTLAIGLHTGGVLGKLYAETLEEVRMGPIEALRAAGARRFQILIWGMWPQARPLLTSYTVLRWEMNLRISTVLGLVGGGGLGQAIYNNLQLGFYARLSTLILIIYSLVLTTDWLGYRLRIGPIPQLSAGR